MDASTVLRSIVEWLAIALAGAGGTGAPAAAPLPEAPASAMVATRPDPGVVYFLPDSEAQIRRDMARIREQGYRHVNLASWVWTLPQTGSGLERRVGTLLDAAHANGLGVWLLHNLQYGNPEEGGDVNAAFGDPAAYARPLVAPWVRALRGHPAVRGVQLGNEVGPLPEGIHRSPRFIASFRAYLQEVHGDVATLNRRWGTRHASFARIGAQSPRDPGYADYERYARRVFGHFYGSILDTHFKPALGGALGYTSKVAPDPYLFRDAPSFTVLGWSGMVANHPAWQIRLLADTDRRPVFNNELHLYHDQFQYFPSVERTRHRYLVDVLNGQLLSSSFAWGSWTNPAVSRIHARTPAALEEQDRLGPALQRFTAAAAASRTGVLVAEEMVREGLGRITEGPALERAYAAMAATGRDWRFLLDLDLARDARNLDRLVILSPRRMPLATAEAILGLPQGVEVHWVGEPPAETEYGQPLPASLRQGLAQRGVRHNGTAALTGRLADPSVDARFRETVAASYGWFSPQRGHFNYEVRYPRLEVRRTTDAQGRTLVALVNHTERPVRLTSAAELPWLAGGSARDLASGRTYRAGGGGAIEIGPLDVRVLRYE
jgi:hypothetical protein